MKSPDHELNPFAPPESDLCSIDEEAFPYAFIGRRAIAFGIDVVIVHMPMIGALLAWRALYPAFPRELTEMLGVVIWIAVYVTYCAAFESSDRQATLGKRLLWIYVVDLSGKRLSFRRAFLRNLGKVVSYSLCGIGFLMQPFTVRKQTLHDLMARTLVINKTTSVLNGNSDGTAGIAPIGETGR